MAGHFMTVSVLILAIFSLRKLTERKISPYMRYGLWILVAVKLLIPMPNVQNPFNILNVPALFWEGQKGAEEQQEFPADIFSINIETGKEERSSAYNFDMVTSTGDFDYVLKKNLERKNDFKQGKELESGALENKERDKKNKNHKKIGKYIWFFTSLLCAIVFLGSNFCYWKKVRKNRRFLGKYQDSLPIYQLDGLSTPCLFCIFHPAIYIDIELFPEKEQREYILVHEYTHYCHGDMVWNLLRVICISVYWFHPLVWLAIDASKVDSELACDAGVLKRLGEGKEKEYGKTLLWAAQMSSVHTQYKNISGLLVNMTGGKKEMKKRMEMLLRKPKMSAAALFVCAFIISGIVLGTSGSAVEDTEELVGTKTETEEASKSMEDIQTTVSNQNVDVDYIEDNRINDTVDMDSNYKIDNSMDNEEQQETEAETTRKERLQQFLEDYFTQFLNTMHEDSTADFSKEDFLSVNGYILAKTLVWKRVNYKLIYNGIQSVTVKNVEIDDIQKKKNTKNMLEVKTYVNYKYVFGEGEVCRCGGKYDVVIEQNGDAFTVKDLDNHDIVIRQIKSNLKAEKQKNSASDEYKILDKYFKKLEQWSEEAAE